MKLFRKILAILLLLAVPSVAEANAGTPLMWASMLHLVFGNLLIGIAEGALLAKVFGLSARRCIGLLIMANYLSAWLGGLFIGNAIAKVLPMGLHNAWPLLWLMVFMTYALTLLIEYPFVAIAFRGDSSWRQKSIRGSLIIQTLSYFFIFGWYWLASGTSLYTKTEVVAISSISLPEKVLVYFISVEDGDIYMGSLQDRQWKKIFDLNSSRQNDRLFARPSDKNVNSWDLVARLDTDDRQKPNLVTVAEQFSFNSPQRDDILTALPQDESSWFNFGPVSRLGEAQSSKWDFSSGFWPIEGLSGTEKISGERVWVSLETPFVAWVVRNVVHLPTDKVLLQLGDDQICIYDPEKKQIALVAQGRGPIAVLQNNHSIKVINL